MSTPAGQSDDEWRSYVDDEDDGEEFLAPDPFALPLPAERENT
jgi:hypothetical protein